MDQKDQGTSSAQIVDALSPSSSAVPKLDLSQFPPIFLSSTHFPPEDLHRLEDDLSASGANLTFDIHEAKIVLSRVAKKARARFDLRERGLPTDELVVEASIITPIDDALLKLPPAKRRRLRQAKSTGEDQGRAIVIDDSSTASEDDDPARRIPKKPPNSAAASDSETKPSITLRNEDTVTVLKADWFAQSQQAGMILPFDNFITYQGRSAIESKVESVAHDSGSTHSKLAIPTTHALLAAKPMLRNDIIDRAKEDASQAPSPNDRFGKRKLGPGPKSLSANPSASWAAGHGTTSQYAHLLQQTTTEHDEEHVSDLPEMPEWVKEGVKYACQRLTPKHSPNEAFIALLKKITIARLLTNDEIGVRAYSTSMAAIAAYPYRLSSPREIVALPGCDQKVANLFVEWANTGKLNAVEDIEADTELKILHFLYEIWGVGATTAREFYFDHGWKDLDDIVEYGWSTLSRVQQIGVKFYDEFQDPIPRVEVEQIGDIIRQHAVKIRDDEIQTMIVGGYRRGKEACGDVDIIISHPDEDQTADLVNDIVASLEDEGWITHTLLLSLRSTHRSQQTLPFRSNGGGHGFDSLDKALVVWQKPSWPSQVDDMAANPQAKNPNIHRRVDIIIAPWRSVGCAVVGWSGGTIFERDLRRYAKYAKGWKFDSSGVRDRGNGEVVDVERFYSNAGRERATTMPEAERRVFDGMGLTYREPWERCTG